MDKTQPGYGPTWISVRSKKAKAAELSLKTEEIFENNGHVSFNVPVDGEVEICIRASTANSKQPMRFGLNVEQEAIMDDDSIWNDGVSKEWTRIEEEIRLSMKTMRAIQAEADYSKDRDAAFHKQVLDMYAASMYWPIVHVCVLLLTGFTQATHIVRFFKSRRIV